MRASECVLEEEEEEKKEDGGQNREGVRVARQLSSIIFLFELTYSSGIYREIDSALLYEAETYGKSYYLQKWKDQQVR